jgi:hypothetical protein
MVIGVAYTRLPVKSHPPFARQRSSSAAGCQTVPTRGLAGFRRGPLHLAVSASENHDDPSGDQQRQ